MSLEPLPVSNSSLETKVDIEILSLDGTEAQSDHSKADTPVSLILLPEDVENPRNWSTKKKVIINFVLCTWILSLTYSSTAYVASIADVMDSFSISKELAISGISLFVVGLSAGPLLFAPISEVFGRRFAYSCACIGYTIFAWITSESNNPAQLLICRFLTGFFGSASINNVPSSIGDFTYPQNRMRYTVLYAIMSFGGPALGPLAGIYIQQSTNPSLRWNSRVQAIFITITSLFVLLVPETHSPTLQRRKLAREGIVLPIPSFFKTLGIALTRPVLFLFTEPIVTLISLYLSVLYGILYCFFPSFAVVYVQARGFTQEQYALTYIGLGVGFMVGALILATAGEKFYQRRHDAAQKAGIDTPPEARLSLAYIGAIINPISLFIFAWTAPFPRIHYIIPVVMEGLFSCSMLMIFTAFIPYLIDVYAPFYAASALASGMASRALVGSVFPLFSLQMYDRLSIQGATSLLAGLAVLLAPIPFVFSAYGERLRKRSNWSGQKLQS